MDVGQGDSILLTFPDGKLMLVDGGGIPSFGRRAPSQMDIGEDVVSPYLWDRSISHIDVMACTHAHADHIGGLPSLLENFHAKELWTGANSENPAWRASAGSRAQGRRAHRAAASRPASRLRRRAVGGAGARSWIMCRKTRRTITIRWSFRVTFGRHSFLLSGDIERQIEAELVAEGLVRKTDVLKVPHHGSKTSSTAAFLDLLRPGVRGDVRGLRKLLRAPARRGARTLRRSGRPACCAPTWMAWSRCAATGGGCEWIWGAGRARWAVRRGRCCRGCSERRPQFRFRLGLLHQLLHVNPVDGRLAIPVALKENLLAVGGKDRRHHGRIAGAVFAQATARGGSGATGSGCTARRGSGWRPRRRTYSRCIRSARTGWCAPPVCPCSGPANIRGSCATAWGRPESSDTEPCVRPATSAPGRCVPQTAATCGSARHPNSPATALRPPGGRGFARAWAAACGSDSVNGASVTVRAPPFCSPTTRKREAPARPSPISADAIVGHARSGATLPAVGHFVDRPRAQVAQRRLMQRRTVEVAKAALVRQHRNGGGIQVRRLGQAPRLAVVQVHAAGLRRTCIVARIQQKSAVPREHRGCSKPGANWNAPGRSAATRRIPWPDRSSDARRTEALRPSARREPMAPRRKPGKRGASAQLPYKNGNSRTVLMAGAAQANADGPPGVCKYWKARPGSAVWPSRKA